MNFENKISNKYAKKLAVCNVLILIVLACKLPASFIKVAANNLQASCKLYLIFNKACRLIGCNLSIYIKAASFASFFSELKIFK